ALDDAIGSAVAAAGEEAADGGASGEAGELGERAGEGEGELEGGVAAGFDGGALAGGDVFHGAARDGARAVAADLDDEARDDRGLADELAGWRADQLGGVRAGERGRGVGRWGLGALGLVAIGHGRSVAWMAIRYTRGVLARWFALVALSACGRIGF